MNVRCPYCSALMVPGKARVHGTFLGFLLHGFSYQNLWFRRDDATDEEEIVPSGGSRAGHQCPRCGAVSINRLRETWPQPPEWAPHDRHRKRE